MKEARGRSVTIMQKGLEGTFREAFESYSDDLFRHAFFRLSNRERALELTQECFLKVWQYASAGGDIRDIRSFLYRTLRNLIIDEYRRSKSYSLDAILEDEDGGLVESVLPRDETNTLEAACERYSAREAVAHLKDIPDLYREVLLLRYMEGLSPKEIASRIRESENVVSVRIHRGLKKLRTILEENEHHA